jgi:hypothetical protein
MLLSCLYGDGDDDDGHRVVGSGGVADAETSKFGTSVGTNVGISVGISGVSECADNRFRARVYSQRSWMFTKEPQS